VFEWVFLLLSMDTGSLFLSSNHTLNFIRIDDSGNVGVS
jgi:hypothetical protein